MPAISGNEYIERINQLKTTIWYNGEPLTGEISEHAAFKGAIKSQAALYDLQHDPELIDVMTYTSPKTGNKIGISYQQPKTQDDLIKRSQMIQKWAKTNHGMLGRSPDYMNSILMALSASASLLEGKENCFPENLINFYELAREKDLSFTHTFINPQVNRSPFYLEETDEPIAAKIIDEIDDGLVIKGARLLATQGGMTDEILVISPGGINDPDYAFAFSIPSDTNGLKFICRESFALGDREFNHPLSSRFEEMDAIVVFDKVVVPWDRVFFYKNIQVANSFLSQSAFRPFALHQVINRQIVKLEFIASVTEEIVQSIDISGYGHVHEKMAEIIIAIETMKALLLQAETKAAVDEFGLMRPDLTSLQVASCTFPKIYPRLIEIIQLLGASGMVTIPTESDFESSIRKDLDQYLQSAKHPAKDRVELFRRAWDLTMSPFATRQTQYERFFFGNPSTIASDLYQNYTFN
ncbi:4-hydroxyphenylacetate 3-monooxygenase, oxygenase component [Ornithinibacillus sp. L9]|uniref:4-hydroxyphenylacetate 3-monooxygenase, oxygenase component n=1 Tax=Ornithinibacillus caprae TaxID=2678566 RepID=A0A6N8FDS8_9BACI|nr:4-hydroxyphenylacetate 3-monooxygenase, oxygenase component [Ornithinibacillus caprae]MUK87693.1 4-hydroxyphenylacetate 3-monooxygenase, oxygenase component [Ornithinibacillus caprae]